MMVDQNQIDYYFSNIFWLLLGVASIHVNFAYERCCNDEEGIKKLCPIAAEKTS